MPPTLAAKWNGPTTTQAQVPYAGTVAPAGGATPYRFALVSGALPEGVSLDTQSGKLQGSPQTSGDFRFVIGVIDRLGAKVSVNCTLAVSAAAPTPTAAPTGSPATTHTAPASSGPAVTALEAQWEGPKSGVVGKDYSGAIVVSGGVTPYSFARENGSLPDGLKLDRTTGKVTGTPLAAGSFSYGVTVSDANGETFVVSCPLSIDT